MCATTLSQLLRDRGLITDLECAALKRVEKKPAHVCMWALRLLYRLQHKGKLSEFQANELKMHITGVRGFAAKQIAYHNTPLPVRMHIKTHLLRP